MSFRIFPFRNNKNESGIVRPYNKNLKPLPNTGVICAVKKDLDLLKQKLSVKGGGFGFLMSHIYKTEDYCLAGPYFGSPYAAAIVETLADSGIKNIIAIGWCGALDESLKPGDIIIPDCLSFEDNTCKSYIDTESEIDFESDFAVEIKSFLNSEKIEFKEGKIWTTNAIYRETPEKIKYFKDENAVAVEMENSAVLSAAKFLNINAVCINIVSDILTEKEWKPGFGSKSFKESRIKLINGIKKYVSS